VGEPTRPVLPRTVVIDANLSTKVVTTTLNHYSLTRFYAQTLASPHYSPAKPPRLKAAFGLSSRSATMGLLRAVWIHDRRAAS
jgi:hypothetical protein